MYNVLLGGVQVVCVTSYLLGDVQVVYDVGLFVEGVGLFQKFDQLSLVETLEAFVMICLDINVRQHVHLEVGVV